MARVRAFVNKHPALTLAAMFLTPVILLDRFTHQHALAMVLAIYAALSLADAWDQETR